jgi:copper homeostasis protein
MVHFELCCADIESVLLADQYGVGGIELCSQLSVGGNTPSLAFIKEARRLYKKELAVLIRLRSGNFCYSELEKKIMLDDIRIGIDNGVDTIVFGALNQDNSIDEKFIEQVIGVSSGSRLCFHKAIDDSQDILESLNVLMHYQIDRVLTSGGKSTALEGIDMLKKLQEQSESKIEIMAGGSINSSNVKEIIDNIKVNRIHAALRDLKFFNLYNIEKVDENELKKVRSLISILK